MSLEKISSCMIDNSPPFDVAQGLSFIWDFLTDDPKYILLVWMDLKFGFCRFLVSVTDLSEAMSVSTSPDSSKEEEDFPPPPVELLHPDNSGEYTHNNTQT